TTAAPGARPYPRKCPQGTPAVAANVGVKFVQLGGGTGLAVAGEQHRLLDLRMASEEARQFKTGVTGCSNNRGLDCLRHQARMSSRRVCSFRAFLLSGVMMSTVSSPATVPTTSSQPSASTARATG